MAQTRQEIRNAWNKEHLAQYAVWLNRETDKELVEFIENGKANGHSASSVIKAALYKAIQG